MDNVEYLYYKYLNKYKEQIKTNNTLIVLKLIHLVYQLLFFVSIILLLFVKYDSKIHYYILGVWVIIIIHWVLLKGECIIDLIEKKILNKKYKTGDIIVFLIDFNYNLITKKNKKYSNDINDISSFRYIKLLKLVVITLALYKININIIYKLIIITISLLCLFVLYRWQVNQAKYINNLNRNNKIFQL
tara:strand:- start:540 stop:1103 length:564 start_codon:yes stop_codon:yes gene_type:complete